VAAEVISDTKIKRVLLVLLATVCLTTPLAAEAQPAGKLWRVGVLLNLYPPDAAPPRALRQGLRELGYVEGENLVIDWRYQLGQDNRLPDLAAELVRLKPDVIVADVTVAIRAAMRATSTLPIVMAISADAVGSGFVSNLGRPGKNVTGVTIMLSELSTKRLQLLKEVAPNASRVAVLWNPTLPCHPEMLKEVEVAAPSLRLQPVLVSVRSREDFGNAFMEITNARVDALFVSDTMTSTARRQLVDFAAKNRLPGFYPNRDYVVAGGLVSYAANFADGFRLAAQYVDMIFKGSRPGDLPVEQPTRFELVINMKTAKALGLTVPSSILARADEVIQ